MVLEKLIMSGHSHGGAAALRISSSDKRVKCCAVFDPWLVPLKNGIEDGSFDTYTQDSIFIINNESFLPTSWELFWPQLNLQYTNKRLLDLVPKQIKLMHALHKTGNHNCQSDSVVIWPFEAYLEETFKQSKLTPLNFIDIMFSNFWMALVFLDKTGFGSETIDMAPIKRGLEPFLAKQEIEISIDRT